MKTDTMEIDSMEIDTMETDTVEADTGDLEAGALGAGADNHANIWFKLDDEVGEEEMPPVFSDLFDGTESIQNFLTLLVLAIWNNFPIGCFIADGF